MAWVDDRAAHGGRKAYFSGAAWTLDCGCSPFLRRLSMRWTVAGAIGLTLGVATLSVWWRFDADIKLARANVAHGSALIDTRCGPIEYQQVGTGIPLLAVHGSGGGYDQGLAFAGARWS